jgi:hypothetical protein
MPPAIKEKAEQESVMVRQGPFVKEEVEDVVRQGPFVKEEVEDVSFASPSPSKAAKRATGYVPKGMVDDGVNTAEDAPPPYTTNTTPEGTLDKKNEVDSEMNVAAEDTYPAEYAIKTTSTPKGMHDKKNGVDDSEAVEDTYAAKSATETASAPKGVHDKKNGVEGGEMNVVEEDTCVVKYETTPAPKGMLDKKNGVEDCEVNVAAEDVYVANYETTPAPNEKVMECASSPPLASPFEAMKVEECIKTHAKGKDGRGKGYEDGGDGAKSRKISDGEEESTGNFSQQEEQVIPSVAVPDVLR